jgi:hypothetical protein
MTEFPYYLESLLIQLLIFPLLYAETHYRFKYFFSYLKKDEPEIITDIPSRITSGTLIPILVIIKDANIFPVIINQVTVFENKKLIFSKEINKQITTSYKDLIFYISSSDLITGNHYFDIKIEYILKGKKKTCTTDNHRGTSHNPLPIFIAQDPLPRFDNCILGETHSHTNYTSDQVEFGASLDATRIMARALDLNFFCATDHSYDLDDFKDNYLLNDPDLSKWIEFQREVELINQKDREFLIIPGEEVTVRNNQDKNVHLLIYNSKKFFPGAGDSGEKWLRNYSELSIPQVVSQISNTALAVAAHPSETPPFLQKWLINRGSWRSEDCAESGLHGLQFINGGKKLFLTNGKNLWVEQLLSNNRLTGIAGNDAHGNFSIFRQIGFPFYTMRENYNHLFGKWLTGIYLTNNELSTSSILDALKRGHCYMTDGPALRLQLENSTKSYVMGEECSSPERGKIMVRSSEEFGGVKSVKILLGDLDKKVESVYLYDAPEIKKNEYTFKFSLDNIPDQGYLRAEILTEHNNQALSNPIWFNLKTP